MLNKVLPDDIRALGWSPVEPTFDARFSAKSRTYKYFFFKESLDIEAMREAAQYFVGVHDFRNFCRMDAENVSNYVRTLLSFEIEPANDSVEYATHIFDCT
jgi:tRNA pseudouridine38/39 synthase